MQIDKNTGLVLEGGGMRGLYTAGVLDYFMEKHTYFKDCIGVSAGANHGSSYLSKQKGRSLDIVLKYLDTKQYASPTALFLTGNFFDKKFHRDLFANSSVFISNTHYFLSIIFLIKVFL